MSRPAHPRPVLALLTSVLLLVLPAAAHAAWPHSPTANLLLGPGSFGTQRPAAIPDGAGGAIAVWVDLREPEFELRVYALRVTASGAIAPGWPAGGFAVCNVAGYQENPVAIPDGSGGVIIVWIDSRKGADTDLYAQHITGAGAIAPGWPASGAPVCTASADEIAAVLLGDGAGGVLVAWEDPRNGTSDIYMQHLGANGMPLAAWPSTGLPVCRAPGAQTSPVLATDGAGGALVAWQDARTGDTDIYVLHVPGTGYPDPYWPYNGFPVGSWPGEQSRPTIVSDGMGGAIVAWQDLRSGTDYDIYAGHVTARGTFASGWDGTGLPLGAGSGTQALPVAVEDGAGGAIVAWQDDRNGTWDIYVGRAAASGTVAPGWPASGVDLSAAPGDQAQLTAVPDGASGAIVAWQDRRLSPMDDVFATRVQADGSIANGWSPTGTAVCTASDQQLAPVVVVDPQANAIAVWSDNRGGSGTIQAQRMDHNGRLGSPEPMLLSVKDVPNDQGGKVRLAWAASYLEAAPYGEIGAYWVLRSVPAGLVQEALARGEAVLAGPADPVSPGVRRTFLARPEGATAYYWELIASLVPLGVAEYGFVASTTGDSIPGSNPKTAFMIEAISNGPGAALTWFSNADSGYSVDNLAPGTPGPFTGAYAGGATQLHWEASREADFAEYRLYRDAAPGFVPGPSNRIAALTGTDYVDAAGAAYYYRLTAVDIHGNESASAFLLPSGTAGVPGAGASWPLSLAPAAPDPVRDVTTLRFTLPRESHARLAVYDAGGRLVRTLLDGTLPAGEHRLRWDVRDATGPRLANGLYFLRLEAGGVLTRRVLVLR